MSPSTNPQSRMFYDWIKVYQDFPFDIPQIGEYISRRFDIETDELLGTSVPAFFAEGSYSTKLRVHVCGRRITVDGNASRLNRLDNVFGIESLDGCMAVINALLVELKLPKMTKCKTLKQLSDGSYSADGAIFQRLDLTSNFYVGQGNERAFLRGISSQRFRNSIAYLYPDGNTCVWTPKGGEKAGSLVYPGNYNKAAELNAHLLPKVKRAYGEDSDEFRYVRELRDWCASVGMVRSELKCRSEYLKREGLRFWGLFDEQKLVEIHRGFLMVGEKCEISNFDVFTVADELLAKGFSPNTMSANYTAGYVARWQHGQVFDFEKSSVQKHRAVLRKIGIDIKLPFDATRHGVVFIRNVREIERVFSMPTPAFYRPAVVPRHLQLVAA